MKKALLASALMLASTTAGAAGFSYNYLELGFGEVDDGDGLFFGGAAQLQRGLGVIGSFYTLDFDDDADGEIFTAGLQFNSSVGARTDFVGSVQLINAEEEGVEEVRVGRVVYRDPYSVDDTGLLLRGGLRHSVQQNLQLEGDISYNTNDLWEDDEVGIKAGVRFYADRQLSVAVGVASDQELDGLYISGRYDL